MFQKCGVLLSFIWCPFFQVQNQPSEITVNCVLTMTMEGKFHSIMKPFCYIICPDTVIFFFLIIGSHFTLCHKQEEKPQKQANKEFSNMGKENIPRDNGIVSPL